MEFNFLRLTLAINLVLTIINLFLFIIDKVGL